MNSAFSIVLLLILLDCVTNANSLTLKGCHVPLTAFYRLVKALLKSHLDDVHVALQVN